MPSRNRRSRASGESPAARASDKSKNQQPITQRMVPYLWVKLAVVTVVGLWCLWERQWLVAAFVAVFVVLTIVQLYGTLRSRTVPPTTPR